MFIYGTNAASDFFHLDCIIYGLVSGLRVWAKAAVTMSSFTKCSSHILQQYSMKGHCRL